MLSQRDDAALLAWLDEVHPLRDVTALPRVISRAEALRVASADAISYRCRVGRWQRLAPSVYLTSPPATRADRLYAAAMHGGERCAISGTTALVALGLRTVRTVATDLVLVPLDSGVENWGRIRVRRTSRPPSALPYRGVPFAPLARCVADHVLGLRRLDHVQAVVAEVIQREMCQVSDLATELEAGPRRGSRYFREALCDVDYGAHSVPEAGAARLLRRARVGGFEQNAAIDVAGRRFVADFLWRHLAAILEIDSTEYHLTLGDHAATLSRDQALQSAGYAVLHVKPSQLRDGTAFVTLIRAWLAALARRTA